MICLPFLLLIAIARGGGAAAPPKHVHVISNDTTMHVFFLLDRSGSMHSIADDVVGSFNSYLSEQRRDAGGGLKLTLAQFDSNDPFQVVHDGRDINEIADFTRASFQPRGATPLFDSIASLIHKADTSVAQRKEQHLEPERVVLVVLTDGQENSSREFTRSQVRDMIQQREKEAGYSVVFLGANIDSYKEAGDVGIPTTNTQNFAFDSEGVKSAYRSLSRATLSQRSTYAQAGAAEQDRMRADFFDGVKEAEADYQARSHRASGL